ncbi:MAG: choice-of-anchor L domain-containing protein [Alphaproteobacteria bacterium]|nr:choice-of-anchor L domain-containing protein [Alphaproteobacteria bacterium]
MATYVFSQRAGTAIAFKPGVDVLQVDVGDAASLHIDVVGSSLVLSLGGQSVTLSKTGLNRLTTSNITFSDGSALLVGDNLATTKNDAAANTLTGTAHADKLIGLGGNDQLDGRDGGDTYLVSGTGNGFDAYHDTGTSGVDRIVAGSNDTNIGLAGSFDATTSGIEAISSDGHANVRIVGSGSADRLDFSGLVLDGIAQIDGAAGADSITGSAGADVIHGGAGNDAIDGGAGIDVAVFDGLKASYSIVQSADVVTVRDLAPKAKGNDGTDTLRNVEVLRFLDGDVALTQPIAANADSAAATEDGAPVAIAVLANDAGGQPAGSLSVKAIDTTGLAGTVAIDAAGTGVVYDVGSAFQSLKAGATALEAFRYQVGDGSGATAWADVTVAVTGVNDGPSAAADAASTAADAAPIAIDVLANDSDPDVGDTLGVTGVAKLSGGGTFSLVGNQVVFDAGTDFAGLLVGQTAEAIATYAVADASGALATASITVVVAGTAVAGPGATDDVAAVSEDGPALNIDVLANDTGAGLTVVAVDNPGGLGVATTDGAAVQFDPGLDFDWLAAGQSTGVILGYSVIDGAGASAAAQVVLTVTGANDGPIVAPDVVAASATGGPSTIDVIANDYDLDSGDVMTLTGVSVATGGGSFSILGNQLVFDPGSDFVGLSLGQVASTTASYSVTDGSGAIATADVTVLVSGGGVGGAPFSVIDPAQAGANAAAITGSILGSTPGIAVDPASLVMTAGPTSAMLYDGSLAKLGIGPGLLLTSGTVPGTANTVGYFGIDNGMNGDPALDAVVNTVFNTVSYDATSISFSFDVTDPAMTGIKFNAVFGSDEFPEWVDAYVDIGVVLVNGVNVAYFNNDPMAPLSVVSGNLAANYFNDNTGNLDTPSFGGIAVPGVPSTYPIEYDGISNVLSILAPVHLGTNTIKIAIADTGDHVLDSGLFISNLMATDVPTSGVVLDHPCTEGSDNETGTDAAESFDAKGGDDVISAGGGNDVVLGGLGNDTVDGGSGADFVNGGEDDDVIGGGAGDDHLDGGAGFDTVLFTGASADYSVIQIGVDQYQVTGIDDGADIVGGFEVAQFADGNFDLATLAGAGGTPGATILGTDEDDIITSSSSAPGQPFTTTLDDVVLAGDGDDIIDTGDGADEIWGGAGNDQIDGAAGADIIHGGSGHDEIAGGAGADRFVFGDAGEVLTTAANPDQLIDFSSAEGDKIDLHLVDANSGTGGDDAFVLAASFTGVAGQLVIANSGGEDLLVTGDVNGDALADFAIKVHNTAALNGGDFWL